MAGPTGEGWALSPREGAGGGGLSLSLYSGSQSVCGYDGWEGGGLSLRGKGRGEGGSLSLSTQALNLCVATTGGRGGLEKLFACLTFINF